MTISSRPTRTTTADDPDTCAIHRVSRSNAQRAAPRNRHAHLFDRMPDLSPSYPPGKETATQERSFQRPVTVHTAATEPGNLTGRIQARQRLSRGIEHPRREICLDTAQAFPRQNR